MNPLYEHQVIHLASAEKFKADCFGSLTCNVSLLGGVWMDNRVYGWKSSEMVEERTMD